MSGQKIGDLLGEILANRYKCDRLLGKQAGRQTLLARDLKTQQQVVVKLLSFSSDFNWEDLKLFQREVETLKSLSHPAIPQYLDSFEIDTPSRKGFALVQTYIAAKSLQEYLSDGRTFSESEVKQLATALLNILAYLHQRQPPVIHRDIKPSNILLKNRSGNSVGEVYLVDFGAVQTLATQQGKTVTVVGTYGYMPPEQFGGRAVPASDLYSLGATLIALITKQHPADLPQQDLQIEFEQLGQLSPGFTNWLKWMTHPSLDRRPASVQIAKEVLEKPQQIDRYSLPLKQGKTVSTGKLFGNAIERSTEMGTLAVGVCAAIYSAFIIPVLGTIFGVFIGLFLGLLLGLGNGIIVGIVTRLWFFPLTNPKLHRQVLTAISIVLCTWTSIVFFLIGNAIIEGIINVSPSPNIHRDIIFLFAPSLIAGLSMGASSKSIARWYQIESGL
ncbi:serine/threonine protein kinase [Microcoleus sp. LEGE 07076]|uniref:serine/threonine protein kinase n=1 Tax=Microcoleus sp. LEGE 07076 TaxID=915322 RepID=UPI001881B261|nr:serine/threonine-protein kinase [Microcoleus sp. LEGE 07076]MBE9184222.1 serine/threonine protein kinase [Microcoleus sp. LEGE 07076]